jgi:very-short-patch-repair endonuclease
MSLTVFARSLRLNATDAERQLWYWLRGRRTAGMRFRRQQPIGPYIVDFVCAKCRLVVEIDGGQHLESEGERRRDRWLAGHGYVVLRF